MEDKYLKFVSPKGVAQYPWLTKADTKFTPDGVYKVDLQLEAEEAKPLQDKLKKLYKEHFPKGSGRMPFKVDDAGNVVFKFKTKKKPVLFDASGQPMLDNINIYGGSKVKVSATAGPYEAAGNTGITLYLNAVQVIELVQGNNGSDVSSFGFAVEDGYIDFGN